MEGDHDLKPEIETETAEDFTYDNVNSSEMEEDHDLKPEIGTETAEDFTYRNSRHCDEENINSSNENKNDGIGMAIKIEQTIGDETYGNQVSGNQQQISEFDNIGVELGYYNENQSAMFIENSFYTEDSFSQSLENDHDAEHDVMTQNLSSIMKMKFHICKECGKVYRSAWKLMSHLRKKHFPDEPYVCPHCGVYHHDKDEMKEHFKIHTPVIAKPYKCTICTASYYTPSKLQSHLWMHNGNRPYTCGLCSKSFTWSGGLKDHLKIHTGERPFSCKFCDKTFPDTSKLKNHQRTHTGEKPHVCQYCGKGFIESGKLKRHIRTHTGEKPYKCDFCSKSFNVISNLNKHMTVHSGEKPFVCNVCGRGFAQNVNLKSHAKIHTREKDPYKCNVCDKRFERIHEARSHSCPGSQKEKIQKKEIQTSQNTCSGSQSSQKEKVMKKEESIKRSVSRTGRKYKKKCLSSEYLYDDDVIVKEIENAFMETEMSAVADKTDNFDVCIQDAYNVGGDQATYHDGNDDDEVQDHNVNDNEVQDHNGNDEEKNLGKVDEIENYGIESTGNYHGVGNVLKSHSVEQTNNDQPQISTYDEIEDMKNCDEVQDYENNERVASDFQYEDNYLGDEFEENSVKCKNSDSCSNEMADFTDLTNYDPEDEEKVKQVIEKIMNTAELYKPVVTQEYPCTFCGRSFRQMTKLRKHEKIHSGERPYSCKFCGKCFLENSKLKLHLRTHTGEKPHQCTLCQKTFSVISNLRKHMTIHSGEKPYICIICGRGFTQNSNLKSHMRIHTGEKDPYKCEVCQIRFGRIEDARNHKCPGSQDTENKLEQKVQKKINRKTKNGKNDEDNFNDEFEEEIMDSMTDIIESVVLLKNRNHSENDIQSENMHNLDVSCEEYKVMKVINKDNDGKEYIMDSFDVKSNNSIEDKIENGSFNVIIKTEILEDDES